MGNARAKSNPAPREGDRDERHGTGRRGGSRATRRELNRVNGAGATMPVADHATETDRLLFDRVRLGILSALAVNDSLTFRELKQLLATTDGNLSVHARKLENAGLVTCTKSFEGRLPRTQYRLTPAGRRSLEKFLNHMEALIRTTREG